MILLPHAKRIAHDSVARHGFARLVQRVFSIRCIVTKKRKPAAQTAGFLTKLAIERE